MISKNIMALQKLSNKLLFSPEDAAESMGIQLSSSRVFCSRYVKNGLFIKIRNGYYSVDAKWKNAAFTELLTAANMLQVPSYVSLLTALSYYELTSQIPVSSVESVCLKRSVSYETESVTFKYFKMQKQYYFGFIKDGNIFIANREKALLDSLYLYSFGKYKIDVSALDMRKLDKKKIVELMKFYPDKTKKIVRAICRI